MDDNENYHAPRIIAFYLPQYHPIPENDLWWGEGFTEWTNVVKAKPLFRGHDQPHVPADLGYYDLRSPQVRHAQADLAKAYGIYGFCYYHYWFEGKRLLELPLNEVLRSGEPDFPFCICWANENWSRNWDGKQDSVLIKQNYSLEDDALHIKELIPILADRRYIKINGKPIILVYRVNNLPDPNATSKLWREEVIKAGFPGIYLCSVISLVKLNFDPRRIGFDAAVSFPPNFAPLEPRLRPLWRRVFRRLKILKGDPFSSNKVISYPLFAERIRNMPYPNYKVFPGVMPGWDNSPRRKERALIFTQSTPKSYGRWLRSAINLTMHHLQGEEQLVFINAWNEWAEGNHLEPDSKWGRAYLEETHKSIIQSIPT